MKTISFGPKTEKEKRIYAVEGLRVDVQHALFKLMEETGITEVQLAKKLGISKKKVKTFFSASWNPSLVRIAKIFHELGVKPDFYIRNKNNYITLD